MKIIKAYKFRLYPNDEQRILINKTFGCTRFIYNHFLNLKQKEYKETNKTKTTYECIKELTTLYVEYPWLKEVDSMSLRCSLFDLDDAFKRMYKKQGGYPKFKNKHSKNSYRTNYLTSEYKENRYENIRIDLTKNKITLPKLKEVKIRGYRKLETINGKVINATVSKDSSNRYYVSVTLEEEINVQEIEQLNVVGLDLGVKDLVTTSEGKTYENSKALKRYEKRIKMLSRRLSKKQKGSSNYYKTKKQLGAVYRKLKNTRKYSLHQISKELTEENTIIAVEDLTIKSMIENTPNKQLTKNIFDSSFHEIIRQLEYKSKWKNKHLIKVDKYYPSSQTCYRCGVVEKRVKDISVRNWECINCGVSHDRDMNASINIMNEGVIKYYSKLNLV